MATLAVPRFDQGPCSHGHGVVCPAGKEDSANIQLRAYEFWSKLAMSGEIPAVEDLDEAALAVFGKDGALFDLTMGHDRAVVSYMGQNLAGDCPGSGRGLAIARLPAKGPMSHLAESFVEAVANRAPVGFAFDMPDSDGVKTSYRSIHLPFSSDGRIVDFVFSAIEALPRD